MATELAKAYVQIIPSAEGIRDKISEELGGSTDSAGQTAGSKFVSALKKAVAAAGIGTFIKNALSEGGELQQNLGGTEAVFGQFASSIQKSATDAYKNMGMSASDYMATANKMGSLFQGSGLEQQRSLELTSKAMQRAADVASVMGIDTASAMESIAGAAKGNFTMMDNLGVSMNATTLQAYALEKGINFKWDTASNAQKAELAMQMFFDRTEQYAGNFANESQATLSGSLEAVKASFSNVLGNLALGNDIGPSLQALSETVVVFLSDNLLPAIVNIIGALPGAAITLIASMGPDLAETAIELVQSLGEGIVSGGPQLYESVMTAVGEMQTVIAEKLPEMLNDGVEMISSLAEGILQNAPAVISAIGNILSGILGGLLQALPQLLTSGVSLVGNLAQGILNNLPAILSSIASVLAGLLARIAQSLPELLQKGIELIGKLAAGIIQAIPTAVAAIPDVISGIKESFGEYDWAGIGLDIIKGVANGISGAVGTIAEAARGAARSAFESAKEFLGIKSPSRLFMWIGKQTDAGLAQGLEENTGPIATAVRDITKMMVDEYNPEMSAVTDYDITSSVGTSTRKNQKTELFDRLDQIIYLLELLTKQEIKVIVKDREVLRILRDLGVSFA